MNQKNRMIVALAPSIFGLLLGGGAEAACPYIQEGFTYKMKQYRAYRDRNEKSHFEVLGREKNCKTTGAKVSAAIATKAEAQSCEAQGDASRLNLELEGIGGTCEENFAKLYSLQVALKNAFESVRDDLEGGMKYMENSRVLKEFCPSEISLGRKMISAFLKLESDIVFVEGRSLAGKVDYGKFKDAALHLKLTTAAANRNCGESKMANGESAGPGTVKNTVGMGSGAVVSAKSANSPSDISGTRKAAQDAALAQKIMNRMPAAKP